MKTTTRILMLALVFSLLCCTAYAEDAHYIHVPELANYKEPSDTEPGYTGDLVCSSCEEILLKGTEIPVEETQPEESEPEETIHIHTLELANAKDATETKPGYTGDLVCSACGETLLKGAEIPVEETQPEESEPEETVHIHTLELANAKDATETEPGYTGDLVCSSCGETLLNGTEIPVEETQPEDSEPPHEHTPTLVNGGDAPSGSGFNGHWECSQCGETVPTPSHLSTLVSNPFEDVKPLDYFYEPVLWSYYSGITNGTTGTQFSPQANCTRAHVVTFLWRAAGSPEPTVIENPFEDVPSNAYYYKAVLWAAQNSITTGVSETEFAPDAVCSRAQIVTFLWRAQGSPALDSSATFSDVKEDQFYTQAVSWAIGQNITQGYEDKTFRPGKTCTRAEVVTFLYRTYAQ